MSRHHVRAFAIALLAVTPLLASAQSWSVGKVNEPIDNSRNPALRSVSDYTSFLVQEDQLESTLAKAEKAIAGIYEPEGIIISLPQRYGPARKYKVVEWDIISPTVVTQIGEQKVYRGVGLDRPDEVVVLDYSNRGLKAMIRGSEGTTFVESILRTKSGEYAVFKNEDTVEVGSFTCKTHGEQEPKVPFLPDTPDEPATRSRAVENLYRFDFAVNTTTEWTSFFGGVSQAAQAVATSISRVNLIYRTDLGIEVVLSYLKNWTGTDPFNNAQMDLDLNHAELETAIGNAAYDIGHLFQTQGGGVAYVAAVGVPNLKGRATSGASNPASTYFNGVLAHEMGHQFGTPHTFNGTTGGCGGGNRSSSTAYEPGSGSTIMGYPGLCGAENVTSSFEFFYHAGSIARILPIRNDLTRGQVVIPTTNNAPTLVSASSSYTIPQSTPFKLSAVASDPDGNDLVYTWDQMDAGGSNATVNGGPITLTSDNTIRPLFRFYPPTTSGTRFFPSPVAILTNTYTGPFEFLPNVNRTMNFRLTARDNSTSAGGRLTLDRVITVSGAALAVTAPNSNVTWAGGTTQTVTWTVGGSATAAPNVNIRLAYLGGQQYFDGTSTLLLANTPNDGSQTVTLPPVASTQARIFVEQVNGNFFDVSNVNFTITAANNIPTINTIAPVTIDEEVPYTFQVVATDLDPAQTLTYSLTGTVPSGATINPSTGLFSWTPRENQSGITHSFTVRVADNGSPAQSATRTFQITVNEVAKIIQGSVELQDSVTPPTGIAAEVYLMTPGTETIVETLFTSLDSSGNFSVESFANAGTYDVRVYSFKHLTRKFSSLAIPNSGLLIPLASLIAGDIDGDNEIGPGDFELIVAAFGGEDPGADVDNDGEVGPSDFEIIVRNFGLGGE
jgi:hypothetical protein